MEKTQLSEKGEFCLQGWEIFKTNIICGIGNGQLSISFWLE